MMKINKFFLVPMCVVLLLTGCAKKNNAYSAIKNEEPKSSSLDIKECERELAALREIDNDKFLLLEQEFEKMMSGSASYANVRNVINVNTQGTIDSLYHYQSAKVCNDIRESMLTGLIDKSGAIK